MIILIHWLWRHARLRADVGICGCDFEAVERDVVGDWVPSVHVRFRGLEDADFVRASRQPVVAA